MRRTGRWTRKRFVSQDPKVYAVVFAKEKCIYYNSEADERAKYIIFKK